MSSPGVVEELPERVQLARECALLGDYERSLETLRDALSMAKMQMESSKAVVKERQSLLDDRLEDDFSKPADEVEIRAKEAKIAYEAWEKLIESLQKEEELIANAQALVDGGLAAGPVPATSSASVEGGNRRKDSTPIWKQSVDSPRRVQAPSSHDVRRPASSSRKPRPPRRISSSSATAGQGQSKGKPRPKGKKTDNPNGLPSYVESMEGSPDAELIKQIEDSILTKRPNVKLDDIAGLEGAKQTLEEAVLYPQLMPDLYTGIRRPWKGVLLFGPPGTGKTMLAKAIATECETCFFNVASSALTSKWRGESEKMMKILFDMARYYAPSTIFFDEVDSIASARGSSTEHEASRRVKSELLTQMDGVSEESGKTVFVLAATNLPWDLDDAIRRRLEKRIYIPLPDSDGRLALFKLATRSIFLHEDVDFEELAERSEGYSGADISNVCHDAVMMPVRRLIDEAKAKVEAEGGGKREIHERVKKINASASSLPVHHKDFLTALEKIQSSVGGRDLEKYQSWLEEYGAQ